MFRSWFGFGRTPARSSRRNVHRPRLAVRQFEARDLLNGGPILTAPALIGPTGAAQNAEPTISWGAVTNANWYQLSVKDVSTGAWGVAHANDITGTSWTLASPLVPGHEYRWFVKAWANAVTSSPWSGPQNAYYTVTPLGTTSVTPSGPMNNLTPTFTWSAITGATSYTVVVNDLTTQDYGLVRQTGLTTTSWTATTPLMMGHVYQFAVRGVNNTGDYGRWGLSTFEERLDPPAVTGASGPGQNAKPTISWAAINNASYYQAYVSDLTAHLPGVLQANHITGTSWTPPVALVPGHEYRFIVRAWSSNGVAGPWSSANSDLYTLTPVGATIVTPSGSIDNLTPTFTWSAVTGANTYSVGLNDLTTHHYNIVHLTGLTTTSWTATTPFIMGDVYQFLVRAWNNSGDYGHVSVSVIHEQPAAPVVTGASGAGTNAKPTITWAAIANASYYQVYVSDLTAHLPGILQANHITSTSWTPPVALIPGHEYRFIVRAWSSNGVPGLWSSLSSDLYTLTPLSAPSITGPSGTVANTTPTFSWSAVTGANTYSLYLSDLTTHHYGLVRLTGLTTTSWTPTTPLKAGHHYRFVVRAWNTSGDYSPWSLASAFTVT